jgi:DNA-directed RNA polymerase specialized sigma subunit
VILFIFSRLYTRNRVRTEVQNELEKNDETEDELRTIDIEHVIDDTKKELELEIMGERLNKRFPISHKNVFLKLA